MKAEASFVESLEMRKSLVEIEPHIREYRFRLAQSYGNLAQLYAFTKCDSRRRSPITNARWMCPID